MARIYLPLRQDAKEPVYVWFVFIWTPPDTGDLNFVGIARDATSDDPQLGSKRNELVTLAAQKLAETRMITFNRNTGGFTITDLGRIAAKYYICYTSIETFNKEFRLSMSEADVLRMLTMSTEVRSYA